MITTNSRTFPHWKKKPCAHEQPLPFPCLQPMAVLTLLSLSTAPQTSGTSISSL